VYPFTHQVSGEESEGEERFNDAGEVREGRAGCLCHLKSAEALLSNMPPLLGDTLSSPLSLPSYPFPSFSRSLSGLLFCINITRVQTNFQCQLLTTLSTYSNFLQLPTSMSSTSTYNLNFQQLELEPQRFQRLQQQLYQVMEAFNLKEEREQGHFDESGNFVWRKDKEMANDEWLNSIGGEAGES
jgi:hypothetical protein